MEALSYGSVLSAGADKLSATIEYAKKGDWTWRAGGFVAGLLIVAVSAFSVFSHIFAPFKLVLDLYLLAFGTLMCLIELQDHVFTQQYLNVLRREALIIFRPNGRALFYLFVGVLIISVSDIMSASFLVGCFTAAVGAIVFVASRSAMAQARALRDAALSESVIKAKFQAADRNRDGLLDTSELALLISALGCNLSRNELEAALFTLDKNGDDRVSYEEFIEWYMDKDDF